MLLPLSVNRAAVQTPTAKAAVQASTPKTGRTCSSPGLFVSDALDGWMLPESERHNGLLVKRPFNGQWEGLHAEIEEALERFGPSYSMKIDVMNGSPRLLSKRLPASIQALLDAAALPTALSAQIHSDACNIGQVIGTMCPFAPSLELRLEVFGENSCARWHQDHYAGRAIVSYTGEVGTEYTSDANVDFWELEHCGNNKCIIRDTGEVRAVDTGDILFIKGKKYPTGAKGLVHKSPEKRYHSDGHIVHRLLLKIDVPPPAPW